MSPAPSLARHFAVEAHNNAWANHRLLNACGELTQEEFAARRTSFFPSIKATLNHILVVDLYYIEVVEKSLAGVATGDARRHFAAEEPYDTCADISREQRACDRRLIALCESLDDARMGVAVLLPRREGVVRDTMQRILAHLFQHQIHHRGQVHAMLAGTRVKPPQLDDFYCANDAPMRAPDFKALGFTEEAIWR